MHTNAPRDLHFARLKRNKRCPFVCYGDGVSLRRDIRQERVDSLREFMSRISPSCLIFFRPDVTYGAFHVGERVLLTSTWISRGGLVERGRKWRQHEKVARAAGSEGGEGRVNTRRSAVVIMKAPTKLETPPLLISSRLTYVRGLHPHTEDILTSERSRTPSYLPR